jgi:hypothetical protein
VEIVVECHPFAELAADQGLAGDGEGDLAGAGVAEAAGAQRDVVLAGEAVDVALVDDAPVGVEEVEGDRGAAAFEAAGPIDGGGRGAVRVAKRGEPIEQPGAERLDAGVDRLDADSLE